MAGPRRAAVLFLALIACPFFSLNYNWIPHNLALASLEGRFCELQHLPGSRYLERNVAVGQLGGCSNHTDFYVGELRSSSLGRQAVEAHYAGRTIEAVYPEEAWPDPQVQLEIAFLERGSFYGYLSNGHRYQIQEGPFWHPSEWSGLSEAVEGQTVYLVSVCDGGYSAAGDLRSH